jgi:hypothetical protein
MVEKAVSYAMEVSPGTHPTTAGKSLFATLSNRKEF